MLCLEFSQTNTDVALLNHDHFYSISATRKIMQYHDTIVCLSSTYSAFDLVCQYDDCDFQVKFEFVTVEMVGEAFEQVVKDQE